MRTATLECALVRPCLAVVALESCCAAVQRQLWRSEFTAADEDTVTGGSSRQQCPDQRTRAPEQNEKHAGQRQTLRRTLSRVGSMSRAVQVAGGV